MSVLDCLPMLITLVASMLALQFFYTLSNIIPLPSGLAQPALTVIIMYFITYVYAKVRCWTSDKWISARAAVPVLIFLVWAFSFVFPMTAPLMNIFGNNPLFIVALSLLYKMIYDKLLNC